MNTRTPLKRHPLMRAVRYLGRHPWPAASALLWRSAYVLIPMQLPLLTGLVVDALAGNAASLYGWRWGASEGAQALRFGLGGLFGVAVLYALSAYQQRMAGAQLSRSFVTHLRKRLVEKLLRLPPAEHQAYGTGALIDRVVSDAGAMRSFVSRVFTQAFTNVLRVGYPIVMLVLIHPVMAAAALSVLPLQVGVLRRLHGTLHRQTRAAKDARVDLLTAVKEHLDGAEALQGLCAERAAAARTHAKADVLEEGQLATSATSGRIGAATWLLTGAGLAATWALGAQEVLAGTMTIGTLLVVTGYVELAYRPFRQFSRIANTYRKGLVSLERIDDLLEAPPTLPERPGARPLAPGPGRITLGDVGFSYDGRPILEGLDLAIEPRTFTAVMGGSGSGKSTLLRLLARLADPERGTIRLDGERLTDAALASVREAVAFVPQRPILFTGTLWENLTLADPEATPEAVRAACEAAAFLEAVEAMPAGFDTALGACGGDLSGGQLIRLGLARALLKRPRVLVLDEPTAALDARSEAAVAETLRRLAQTCTVVAATHRPRTAAVADVVVQLQDGRARRVETASDEHVQALFAYAGVAA